MDLTGQQWTIGLRQQSFNVRSGSKAALTAAKCDFRCALESGLNSDIAACPKRAMSGSRVCSVWVVRWNANYWTRGSLIVNDAPP